MAWYAITSSRISKHQMCKSRIFWFSGFILFLIIFSSCSNSITNPLSNTTVKPDSSQLTSTTVVYLDLSNYRQASKEIVFLDLNAFQSSATDTPTITTSPTKTNPSPTKTKSLTQTPSPEPEFKGCTDTFDFVKHLTISYNTSLKQNTPFAKIWRILNTGTCTWTTKYSIIFTDGDLMGGVEEIPLSTEVKPGEMVDIRIDLIGPVEPNEYAGSWMLQDESGNLFGMGEKADEPLMVKIVIKRIIELKGR